MDGGRGVTGSRERGNDGNGEDGADGGWGIGDLGTMEMRDVHRADARHR